MADLTQLVYASQPFGYDGGLLSGILLDARRCNARDGITGALVCRQDIYLQLLEGPDAPVKAAYARIARDDRHVGIEELLSRQVTDRMFGKWAMMHDPETTWIWTEAQIADGCLDRATDDEIIAMFEQLEKRTPDEAAI